jgi:hypothetical protein
MFFVGSLILCLTVGSVSGLFHLSVTLAATLSGLFHLSVTL